MNMSTEHVTHLEPAGDGQWRWACSCGEVGGWTWTPTGADAGAGYHEDYADHPEDEG